MTSNPTCQLNLNFTQENKTPQPVDISSGGQLTIPETGAIMSSIPEDLNLMDSLISNIAVFSDMANI